jgi:hypothetical protein
MVTVPVGAALRSFSERFASNEPAVTCLAEFAGVQQKTALRWLYSTQTPVGDVDLRVRVFLDAIGYHLVEVERLAQPAQTVLRLIGYGRYEPVRVQEMLGYAKVQSLYRVLLRGDMPGKSVAYRLEMIARDSADELSKAKQPWEERLTKLRQAVQEHDAVAVSRVSPSEEIHSVLLAGLPASPSPTPVMPSAKRRRERPKRTDENIAKHDANNLTAKALTHVIFAFDDLVSDGDTRQLALLVKERVSPKRLQALKRFLDQALKDS